MGLGLRLEPLGRYGRRLRDWTPNGHRYPLRALHTDARESVLRSMLLFNSADRRSSPKKPSE